MSEKKDKISERLHNSIIKPGMNDRISEEEEKKILRKRARQLAKESVNAAAEAAAEEKLDILLFRLAGEVYGFETRWIREVITLKEITPLPLLPRFVKGVINLRGEIISVVDLKIFFELPGSGITDLSQVILLTHQDMTFGILADHIQSVVSIALKELHSELPTLKGIREEYLKGVTSDTIILDAGRILNDKNIIVYEEV